MNCRAIELGCVCLAPTSGPCLGPPRETARTQSGSCPRGRAPLDPLSPPSRSRGYCVGRDKGSGVVLLTPDPLSPPGYRTTLNFTGPPHAIIDTKRSKRQPKDRLRLKQIPFLHDRGVADSGAENPCKIVACQEGSNPGEKRRVADG